MEQKTWVNQCVSNSKQCTTGRQCNFLRTGVILVYLLVFDIILAARFWIRSNLHRLNYERLLKSDVQIYSNSTSN